MEIFHNYFIFILIFFPVMTVRLFGRNTLGVFVKNFDSMLLAILEIGQQIIFSPQNKFNLQFHLKKYNSSYAHLPLLSGRKYTERQACIKILGQPTKYTINDSKFEFLTQSHNNFIFNQKAVLDTILGFSWRIYFMYYSVYRNAPTSKAFCKMSLRILHQFKNKHVNISKLAGISNILRQPGRQQPRKCRLVITTLFYFSTIKQKFLVLC